MTSWHVVFGLSALIIVYAYFGYPLLLMAVARLRPSARAGQSTAATKGPATDASLPRISITLPAYNASATLRPVLDGLTRVDYPRHLRQILVVSDGSTDGTDALVREYAHAGVELLRIEGRLGKTEVENRAMQSLTGDIVINTDASVTVDPGAIRHLVAALEDPEVGVASGRDISVASVGDSAHGGEAAYVGYEMWVRDLETSVCSIVGSSGCLYAIRTGLHRRNLPGHLSRDFSSALWARLNGVRAVSVSAALCYVPRAASMRIEYRRKIRTMSRGIQTLLHHGQLLDPFRHGLFAWLLWSHKLIRWLVPWALVTGAISIIVLAPGRPWAMLGVSALAALLVLAALGWWWPFRRAIPRLASAAAFFVSGTAAGLAAWKRALADQRAPIWEPTPRALAE